MRIEDLSCFYSLRLADGQEWLFVGSDAVKSWLDSLASIMQLRSFEPTSVHTGELIYDRPRTNRLVFIPRSPYVADSTNSIRGLDADVAGDLLRSGWKLRDLKLLFLWSHNHVADVICELVQKPVFGYEPYILDTLKMKLALLPIYQRAQDSGGLPFHAGLVERYGTCVLLAAPGKTGKSTCCRRIPLPWHALCDDETLVVRSDRKGYLAHPFPTWSDYLLKRSERTWNVQQYLPLAAIFFLEQAETDEIVPLAKGQATMLTYQSATQVWSGGSKNLDYDEKTALRKKLFDNACELARTVPTFKLHVSLSGRFWREMEKVLPEFPEAVATDKAL